MEANSNSQRALNGADQVLTLKAGGTMKLRINSLIAIGMVVVCAQVAHSSTATGVAVTATTKPKATTTTRPKVTTTTRPPSVPYADPGPPIINVDQSLMSYDTTGRFRIVFDNIVNSRVADPSRYMELRLYQYRSNYVGSEVVCGDNKWDRVRGANRAPVTPYPQQFTRVPGTETSFSAVIDLSPWFKAGERYLMTVSQYQAPNELFNRGPSVMSQRSCYENSVALGWDQGSRQYKSCLRWGYIGEFIKYTWKATGIGKLLNSAALRTLNSSSPAAAARVKDSLTKAGKLNAKTLLVSTKQTASGTYQVAIATSDGERAVKAATGVVTVLSEIVQANSPLLTFILETANFLAGMRSMADRIAGNCERIWSEVYSRPGYNEMSPVS